MTALSRETCFRLFVFLWFAAALVIAPIASAQTTPRIFVDSFQNCGGRFSDGLIEIDPVSGDRRQFVGVEDVGGVCVTRGSGQAPFSIRWVGFDPAGAAWVADGSSGSSRLLRIEYPSGAGTLVSGCDHAGFGPCLGGLTGTGVLDTLIGGVVSITATNENPPALSDGDLVTGMSLYSTCGFSADSLILIDAETGNRSVLSGLDSDCVATIGGGDSFLEINGVYVTQEGTILVADGDGGIGRIFEVDPLTGDRTVVSGCEATSGYTCVGSMIGAGPIPVFALGIVPLDEGEATLASLMPLNSGSCFGGTILKIDRATGNRTILSGEDVACTSVGAGPPFVNLESVAGLPSLDLVTSEDGGIDRIFRIDAATGARSVLSGCSIYSRFDCVGPTIGSGPTSDGYGSLTVPEPSSGVMLGIGGLTLVLTRARRRPRASRCGGA